MMKKFIFLMMGFVAFLTQLTSALASEGIEIKENNPIPDHLLRLYEQNKDCEFLNKFIDNYDVFLEIYKACDFRFMHGCGSYLFGGRDYVYSERMYEKQKLLYETAKKCDRFLEIGVYMGHSLFIVLLANPNIEVTCIDIDGRYSRPALEVLSRRFSKSFNFIQGDSLTVLPLIDETFDLFHIDGHHTAQYLEAEFNQCLNKRFKSTCFFVIDDYDAYPNSLNEILKGSSSYSVLDFSIPNCFARNIVMQIFLK
jgi:hypothetical protein